LPVVNIMSKDPNPHLAFKQMAMHALQQQRYSEAISYAATACKQSPRDAEPWLVKAIAFSQTGDLRKAEQHSRKALKLAPTHAGAYLILGNIFQAQGKLQDAVTAYKSAIIYKHDFVEVMNNLGSLLRCLGQLEEAEDYLNRALTLIPDSPVIMTNLALVNKDKGNHSAAIDIYQHTLKIHPDYADAHYNLANLLQLSGKTIDAERHYRKAIECKPGYVMAMHGLGQLLTSQGNIDEALQILELARDLQPGLPDISAAIADIYEKKGNDEMAIHVLKPLLASKPVSPGATLCFAKLAPRLNRYDEAVNLLKHQLTNPVLPSQIKTDIHFSIGKLLDSMGNFDEAFEYFRLGNTSSAITNSVPETGLAQLKLIQQLFSQAAQAGTPRSSNTSSQPVFIVGMPRSGTTLVEQILASHPLIAGAGELPYIGDILNSFPERFGPSKIYPACIDELSSFDLTGLAEQYLHKLSKHAPDAARIVDKMPHNFLHLGLIDRLFPNARVIHCVRNPLDTCLSIYFHNFSGNHPYSNSLRDLGEYYKGYIELMEYWKSIIRIPLMDVVYEDLIANQETVCRNIISFCEVDWDDHCLRFNETERIVNTPSYDQVRQPIYTKSVERWKNYEAFLGPLISALN